MMAASTNAANHRLTMQKIKRTTRGAYKKKKKRVTRGKEKGKRKKEKRRGVNEKGKKAKKGKIKDEIVDSDVRQHDVHSFS